jgi:hypothetical protein
VSKPARRPAHATADIEHMMIAANSRDVSQCVQRFGPAVMVLVEVLEVVLGQRVG